jgi:acetyl esterase/lipase
VTRFNSDATIQDVLNDKELKEYSEFFYYKFPLDINSKRIDDTSWYAREAINWFYEKKVEKKTSIIRFNKHNKDVNLIQISHKKAAKFAFIVSGGGFVCIDTAHEGIPIAKELYEKGYDIFLLTYRLNENAKLNKTTIDINDAISYIVKNKTKLNVDVKDFLLVGGSAGAYIASSYCSNNRGYIKHHNPKPKCLCLLYPIVDFHMPESNIKEIVIGPNPSKYLISKYSVINHASTFPPTLIVHSKDDDCVPVSQSEALHESLNKNNIRNQLLLYETGKHGWGIGKKLEPESWLELFYKFILDIE